MVVNVPHTSQTSAPSVTEDFGQIGIVNMVGTGKTDGSGKYKYSQHRQDCVVCASVPPPDAGIVGEIERLQQGEDSEVVEPVVLLVERVEVIFRHGHGHLSPVPL